MSEFYEALTQQEQMAFAVLQHPEAPLAMMRAQLDDRDVAIVGVVEDQGPDGASFTPLAMLVNLGGTYGEELYRRMVPPEGTIASNTEPAEREFLSFAESQFEDLDFDGLSMN